MTEPERWLSADRHGVVFYFDQEAERVQVRDDLFAGDVAVERVVFRAGQVDVGGLVEDGEAGQRVALADGEVVGVVRGRDLDGAGAELGVAPSRRRRWGSPRSVCFAKGRASCFADEVLVALVLRIHRDCGIAEKRFGARGRDDDGAGAVGERVADRVELADALLVDDFEVGDGGLDDGVPVDDVGAAIDEALLVQADEGFDDGL